MWTKAQLIEFQDSRVKVATELLLSEGHLIPMIDVVIDGNARQKVEDFAAMKVVREVGRAPEPTEKGDTVVSFPFTDDAQSVLGMVSAADPQMGTFIALSAKAGRTLDVAPGARLEIILKVLCDTQGVHPKDLKASALAGILKRLDAYAFLKIDEAWALLSSDLNQQDLDRVGREGVAAQKGRREVVMVTLEAAMFARTVMVPFVRDAKGKPVLEKPMVLDDSSLQGRYTNLLRRLDA